DHEGIPRIGNDVSGRIAGAVLQTGVVQGDVHVRYEAGAARLTPHQLPAPTPDFVGRRPDLDWLDGHAGTVSVISGAAGIGKTALVLQWAHAVRAEFPDGQLYYDLRGFGSHEAVTCSRALYGFLVSLGVAPEAVPTDLDSKSGLYRSLLDDRKILVVLDNARDSDHVRPLLPSGSGCAALITSRNSLTSLTTRDGAHHLSLDLLSPSDSIALLERRVGADRVAAERDISAELVERCARLPLALSIAAARAVSRPVARLAELVEELSDESTCLDALDLGEVDVDLRAVFSWSYGAVTPAAQSAFRLLGLHSGPDIGLAAAASLTGLPPSAARRCLTRLAAAHLVEEHRPNRYRMHDLLRAYAVEKVASDDTAVRKAAVRRLLDHYLHSSWAAEQQIYAYRGPVPLPPPAQGVTVVEAASYTEAMTWFTTEHAVLLAAIKQAEAEDVCPHVWQLPWSMVTFFDRRGHWLDYARTLRTAAQAATKAGDRGALGRTLRFLGRSYTVLCDCEQAAHCYREALAIFEELGDLGSQAPTHRGMSVMYQTQAQYEKALVHGEIARKLFQHDENRAGEARTLHTLAWCSAELGRYEEGLDYSRQAITLFKALVPPDMQGEASAVDSYAYALHRLGRYADAIAHYDRAIALWAQLSNRFYEANTLMRLGAAQRSGGDLGGAERSWRRAAEIFELLNHRDAALARAELARLTS
ncbi:MAG TPA: tetratricopeptide repeat protein, partial [Lentzea sp.]